MPDDHAASDALALPADLMANRLPPRLLTVESCGNCRFRHLLKDTDVECRRRAPQVSVLMVPQQQSVARLGPGAQPMQAMVPMPFCTFPLVHNDQWCGEWEAKR